MFEVAEQFTAVPTSHIPSAERRRQNPPQDSPPYTRRILQVIFGEEQRILMEVYIRRPAVCRCSSVMDGGRHAPFTGQAGTRRNLHLLFQSSHKTPHRENWPASMGGRSVQFSASHTDVQTSTQKTCLRMHSNLPACARTHTRGRRARTQTWSSSRCGARRVFPYTCNPVCND